MRPGPLEDMELTAGHIRELSSADKVAEFFTYLGYASDARVPMTPEALQMPSALADAVRSIECVTSVGDGALQVYLFELTSVTVNNRRALARLFRNRVGNYLLVLTDDFETLDFVLLDREIPGLPGLDVATRSLQMRQRVLSVRRQDPDEVALRVLRRFTLTEYDADGEPDPYGQYDKLASAYVIAEWSEPMFSNRALFSDYYLSERLPTLREWATHERACAYREVRRLYAEAVPDVRGQEPGKARDRVPDAREQETVARPSDAGEAVRCAGCRQCSDVGRRGAQADILTRAGSQVGRRRVSREDE